MLNLQSYREHPGLSQETAAFTASIFDGDEKICEVSNDGWGGPNRYFPHTAEERLVAAGREAGRLREELQRQANEYGYEVDDLLKDGDIVVFALLVIAEEEDAL